MVHGTNKLSAARDRSMDFWRAHGWRRRSGRSGSQALMQSADERYVEATVQRDSEAGEDDMVNPDEK